MNKTDSTTTKASAPAEVAQPVKVLHIPVFNFDDLNDDAKERARDWWRDRALDYEWWDSTYEDAETVGLKLESFDLDRNRHATGRFTKDASEVIELILANHGSQCETFKTAMQYKGELETAERIDANQDALDDIEEEFLKSLLEDYSIMLQHEYEYLLSDESVDENIRANEYTFTAEGKRAG